MKSRLNLFGSFIVSYENDAWGIYWLGKTRNAYITAREDRGVVYLYVSVTARDTGETRKTVIELGEKHEQA